jgi:hypothetical protein
MICSATKLLSMSRMRSPPQIVQLLHESLLCEIGAPCAQRAIFWMRTCGILLRRRSWKRSRDYLDTLSPGTFARVWEQALPDT